MVSIVRVCKSSPFSLLPLFFGWETGNVVCESLSTRILRFEFAALVILNSIQDDKGRVVEKY